MATVNFSVPEDVKQAFNEAFKGENKSAVVARLMRQAIEEKEIRAQRGAAIDAILELRKKFPALSAQEIRKAREEGRP